MAENCAKVEAQSEDVVQEIVDELPIKSKVIEQNLGDETRVVLYEDSFSDSEIEDIIEYCSIKESAFSIV